MRPQVIDRRGAVVAGLLLALGGCGEPSAPDTGRAGSDGGGGGGSASGSASGGAIASGGGTGAGRGSGSVVGGSAGQAGGGTNLTVAALRDATDDECSIMCTKSNQVCPGYKLSVCLAMCQGQADDAFAAGSCQIELYDALRCINALDSRRIACDPNGVIFNGCDAEQAAYSGC